jgi:hypothetical protein
MPQNVGRTVECSGCRKKVPLPPHPERILKMTCKGCGAVTSLTIPKFALSSRETMDRLFKF